MLDQISESDKVAYVSVEKKLQQFGLGMMFKQLRSYYATKMRELGLLLEQIDLVQGRVGKSIFMQHYFKQDAKLLSSKILNLISKLETTLDCNAKNN